jgi:hypothetical protein
MNTHNTLHQTNAKNTQRRQSAEADEGVTEHLVNRELVFSSLCPPSEHVTTTCPPHRDTIILITNKMAPHVRSSCSPLMITKDMFHALHAHTKIVTRRIWNDSLLTAHLRAARNHQLVRVWSRIDAGTLYGRLVGHVRYTHTFDQRLDQITSFDVVLEGFPTWTVRQFLDAKFPGLPMSTVVHVFMFMFYPKRKRARA